MRIAIRLTASGTVQQSISLCSAAQLYFLLPSLDRQIRAGEKGGKSN